MRGTWKCWVSLDSKDEDICSYHRANILVFIARQYYSHFLLLENVQDAMRGYDWFVPQEYISMDVSLEEICMSTVMTRLSFCTKDKDIFCPSDRGHNISSSSRVGKRSYGTI